MKILYAALFLGKVLAVEQTTDIYYHQRQELGPSMWAFGPTGIEIYSPEGEEVLKKHPQEAICPTVISPWTGETTNECSFFDVRSDGHAFVWAAITSGQARVEAFDIDTGDYVSYIPTCNTPLSLKYHPAREEMWLRCSEDDVDNGHEGHIDVFSVNSLSTDFEQVNLGLSGRVYGRHVVHSKLGVSGYATVYNSAFLYKFDLVTKEVIRKISIPKSHGAYDMTYSPFNSHIFLRARVCCSCGFVSSDIDTCSGDQKVLVTTGPSAGMNVTGACGSECEGTTADTIGVYEYDTVTDTFIGSFNVKEGTGFGADPISSPDGKYVLLLPNDGGQFVRVIKAGANGQQSRVVWDIPVDFSGGTPGRTVVSDTAFATGNNMNIVVIGASSDNDIVLADLDSHEMRKISLTAAPESTGGSSRQLEWAVDTPFVWVSGSEADEVYVVDMGEDFDIDSARVVQTINGFSVSKLVFVEDYMSRVNRVSDQAQLMSSQNDDSNTATAAVIIAAAAFVAVALLFAYIFNSEHSKKQSDNLAVAKTAEPDAKSLGSKAVL